MAERSFRVRVLVEGTVSVLTSAGAIEQIKTTEDKSRAFAVKARTVDAARAAAKAKLERGRAIVKGISVAAPGDTLIVRVAKDLRPEVAKPAPVAVGTRGRARRPR